MLCCLTLVDGSRWCAREMLNVQVASKAEGWSDGWMEVEEEKDGERDFILRESQDIGRINA